MTHYAYVWPHPHFTCTAALHVQRNGFVLRGRRPPLRVEGKLRPPSSSSSSSSSSFMRFMRPWPRRRSLDTPDRPRWRLAPSSPPCPWRECRWHGRSHARARGKSSSGHLPATTTRTGGCAARRTCRAACGSCAGWLLRVVFFSLKLQIESFGGGMMGGAQIRSYYSYAIRILPSYSILSLLFLFFLFFLSGKAVLTVHSAWFLGGRDQSCCVPWRRGRWSRSDHRPRSR